MTNIGPGASQPGSPSPDAEPQSEIFLTETPRHRGGERQREGERAEEGGERQGHGTPPLSADRASNPFSQPEPPRDPLSPSQRIAPQTPSANQSLHAIRSPAALPPPFPALPPGRAFKYKILGFQYFFLQLPRHLVRFGRREGGSSALIIPLGRMISSLFSRISTLAFG
jgi:hypothetical protein